jgi:tRNA(fMet)-specific endonuclease VapC
MRFLLDTNIVSDLVYDPQGRAAARVAEVGVDSVCTSIIVAAEIRYGAAKKDSTRLSRQIETVLGKLEVLALEPPADTIYGQLRARLEREGKLMGPNDLLIASQTLALGFTLVTDNRREFSRIAELTLENWLRT